MFANQRSERKYIFIVTAIVLIGIFLFIVFRGEKQEDNQIVKDVEEPVLGIEQENVDQDIQEERRGRKEPENNSSDEAPENPFTAQSYLLPFDSSSEQDETLLNSYIDDRSDDKEQLEEEKTFQYASFYQNYFERSGVGTVRKIRVNLRESNEIRLVDLSTYEENLLVFRWLEGNFKLGLTNETKVPKLEEVQLSEDETEEYDFLISEFVDREGYDYLFIQADDEITNLSVDLIGPREKGLGELAVEAIHSSGAKYSGLGIIPREGWSLDPDINNPSRLVWDPYYYEVEKIVVHHTATPNNEDPLYWMRAIYLYHKNSIPWWNGSEGVWEYGFGDIAYNYVIDQYGNIYEGKLGGEEAKGYHAGDGNPGSIGIAVIGTYSDQSPSYAAKDALKRFIAERAAFYNFTPNWGATVYGHRDFMVTACPGNSFYNDLPSITVNAKNYKSTHFATLKSVVSTVDNIIDNTSYKDHHLILMYKDPGDIDIPAWSNIESYTTDGSIVDLTITDHYTESSKERMRTLYKVFEMDSDIRYVGPILEGSFAY